MSAQEDSALPGRLLPLRISEKIQRQFVERFVPEHLPRLSPPYWGKKFSEAEHFHSTQISEEAFGNRRYILCVSGRPFSKPARKYLRPVSICSRAAATLFLKNVHWSLGCDLYFFDRTCTWFIAAIEERVFQMSEEGDYILLGWKDGSVS